MSTFLIFFPTRREVHIKHFAAHRRTRVSQGNTLEWLLKHNWLHFSWENDKVWLFIWTFGKIFLKMNKMCLLLQETQVTIWATNYKIWGFKWKLEFWKTCIYYCKLISFPQSRNSLMKLVVIQQIQFFNIVKWHVNI